jgi:3-isopropylmalate dehydrogenase
MKTYQIALLPGDGVGEEVCAVAEKVLQKVGAKFSLKFEIEKAAVGGAAIEKFGEPLPQKTLEICEKSDAILFGSVGDPRFDNLPPGKDPIIGGVLALRKHFQFFANLRPARLFPGLENFSPLKNEIVAGGFDFLIVRELTGGIYFGKKTRGENFATDEMKYEKFEIERIARAAFNLAKSRRGKVCSIDKNNVLETSKFWRETVVKIHEKEFPEIELSHLLIDNATMQILKNPKNFDVILTANLFGDILSDEAAQICGSIGLSASASLNSKNFGLFEPAGGSAPDLAGKNLANPSAQILSAAMMLKNFGEIAAAAAIENSVEKTLQKFRTADLADENCETVGCAEFGEKVLGNL